ncbi:MAG: sulfatase [Candidatus Sumerlaeota bacterium]|nr:sulfatase [Candidatus Sumerlaeota bacterium]
MKRQPNLILIGIDSLRSDHTSLYGYPRLTTPHIDKWAAGGTTYMRSYCPHIPTTSGYANMLTGLDCFGTNIVALRHHGDYASGIQTLPEILGHRGYSTVCVGFEGNPASRGFQRYVNFTGWGSLADSCLRKAENLNAAALPVLRELAAAKAPFFLFLRHMDPHSPYLPPAPFDRMFYDGNEYDPKNRSMEPLWKFKPFCDYFASWIRREVTDTRFVDASYDGEIAYMDSCIARIFTLIETLDLEKDTLVVLTADHGETLNEHDCLFDHHGLYDCTLNIPLVFRWPGKAPAGKKVSSYTVAMNITPTILDIMGIRAGIKYDGASLYPEMLGKARRGKGDSEFYITECTWMRKHGWRTPEWKLIHALEPDFHFKPEVELYNLKTDPQELKNLAKKEPKIVAQLGSRMLAWIARREKETARPNPIFTNTQWHGSKTHEGPFTSSQEAYDTLHIGDPETARKLQAEAAKK